MAISTASVAEICAAAQDASRVLKRLDTETKNAALHAMADALLAREAEILEANERDLEAGRAADLSGALMDRLKLTPERLAGIASDVRGVAALPDPVGEVITGRRIAEGLDMRQVREPLGVVAVVYEASPNRTIGRPAVCRKSGNAMVLRGSSSVHHSSAVLAGVAAEAVAAVGLPAASV